MIGNKYISVNNEYNTFSKNYQQCPIKNLNYL